MQNGKTYKLQLFIGVFLFASFSLLIYSCSSNKYSQSDIDKYLTQKRVAAKTSPISFRLPQGWHLVDANNKELFDLLIVRNDLNVSLSLVPFHSNSSSNNLEKNFDTSILFQKTKFKNLIKLNIEKPIWLNGNKCLPYNFLIENKNYRVIVFQNKNKFYELTLFGENTNIEIEYFIQEMVLASIK